MAVKAKLSSRRALLCLWLIAGLIAGWLWRPSALIACGPFFDEAVYSLSNHPDFPLTDFAAGKIGVIDPAYYRAYLYVAYRYFGGEPLNVDEQAAVVDLWQAYFSDTNASDVTDLAIKKWLAARATVVSQPLSTEIDPFCPVPNGEGQSYQNCLPDAFQTAASTLTLLSSKYGVTSTPVKDWVNAQDIVFANCSGDKQVVPATAPAGEDSLLKAHRAYQMASAEFYSGDYDAARAAFDAIAKDLSSPWAQIAPYLMVRAEVRKATLQKGSDPNVLLASAHVNLERLAASSPTLKNAALRLQSYVEFRLDPAARQVILSKALLQPHPGGALRQELKDYTLLMDNLGSNSGQSDELADWIFTFQGEPADTLAHALERWKATGAIPWEVAAISKVATTDPAAPALMAAAAKVPSSSPAFDMLAYHRARLLVEAAKAQEARAYLDELLAHQDQWPRSALNQLLTLRTTVASDAGEFFRYAQRIPTAIYSTDDSLQTPEDLATQPLLKAFMEHPSFDTDSTLVINSRLPMTMPQAATTDTNLAAPLRQSVARTVWVRALILRQDAIAVAVARLVADSTPDLRAALEGYLAASNAKSRQNQAIMILLKNPGLSPYVDSGVGRITAVNEINELHNNWWTTAIAPAGTTDDSSQPVQWPGFVSPAQKAQAQAEWNTVASSDGPDLMLAAVLEWAKKQPAEPQIPQALHLAIMSARYCTGSQVTAKLSKQAFDLLHARYGKTEWAVKTKYWFTGQ
jgi:hypothetical protein